MKRFLPLLLVFPLGAIAGADEDFLAAREAFRVSDQVRLDAYASRLQGQILEPYAAYWQLRARLEYADPAEIQGFLARYRDTPLAERLRIEWLKQLGKRQQWDLFATEYLNVSNGDTELTCYAIQSRGRLSDKEALREARPLWFSGQDLPESCTPVFDSLINSDQLGVKEVWERVRLAVEANNIGVMKRVNDYLPASQAMEPRLIDAVAADPTKYLYKATLDLKTRAGRELTLLALHRVARTSPQLAYNYLYKIRDSVSDADYAYITGYIAFYAARRLMPEALLWYKEAGNAPLNDQQLAWKARIALRSQNWPEVLSAINAMTPTGQQESTWRYWKARALKAGGAVVEANTLWAPLSNESGFYGLLAKEELGTVVDVPAQNYIPAAEEIQAVQQMPAIRRALALYRLDLRPEANREWVWAIRKFDDRQLLAAAEVARRNDLYDRAINTADKTVQLHDYRLRYLAPFRDQIKSSTSENALDEAWVYGLIRQESRFIANARSSVGASGLMQVMPATAKWIAKRLGKNYVPAQSSDPDTNIAYGTHYLRHVLDRLDNHPVLAAAAYNAGPGRAQQWRGQKPLEGAIYAETIPFNETRDYVKKVMSNTMHYASQFGQKMVTLKQRLSVVAPRSRDMDLTPVEEEKDKQ